MASLYIKDPEAKRLAERAAALQGKTKTQAVKDALREVVERLEPASPVETNITEWMREYRKKHPLPPPTGRVADKAFFDALWGEV